MALHDHPNSNTAEPVVPTPVYDAKMLTSQGNLAYITLDDKIYTLRITRAGKLILTK